MMRVHSVTDIGLKRTVNQDYVFSSLEPVGNLPNLFIVADGMGGHQAGEFASRYAVEQTVMSIQKLPDTKPIAIMNKAISRVNTTMVEKALSGTDLYGMGTTIVIASVFNHILYVANVGDSRLYLIKESPPHKGKSPSPAFGGELRSAESGEHILQITRDHSLVEEMVAKGELTRDSESYHSKKNIITRAIGASASVTADFFEIELGEGDYILLCTDGLTNMVADSEIEKTIHSTKSLQEKTEELVTLANANGGKDNIGVVLIESGVNEVDIC